MKKVKAKKNIGIGKYLWVKDEIYDCGETDSYFLVRKPNQLHDFMSFHKELYKKYFEIVN